MRRGLFAGTLVVVAAALASITPASAQSYPDRSVRIIIAFAAGGTIDTLGRIVAQKLSEAWGQSVFVENRPGASGNIGAAAAAQAPPDGYTLHLGGQVLAVNVTLAPMKGLDPVKDFEPIMWIATAQDVLMVPPQSPFRSVKDLIDYAKAHPGDLNYASLGIGSSGHLATTLFSDLAGIKLQHVPYTSYSQAVTDMISGRISLWITTLGGAIGNIQAGKMRALAVSGRARAAQLSGGPDLQRARHRLRRRIELVRAVRSTRHAERHHCQDQRRHDPHSRVARHEGPRDDARLSVRRRLARQARGDAQARDRQMGRGREQLFAQMSKAIGSRTCA
jgi:tripartite-type tricarboxylate transporter receptor subunit TctC